MVLYLAAKRGRGDDIRDPHELIRLAVRAEWHRDPPEAVLEWLTDRGVRV
jgi:hypothetical protein